MGSLRRTSSRKQVGIVWATGVPGFPAVAGPGLPGSFTRLVPAWLGDLAVRHYSVMTQTTWGTSLGLFAAWCADRDLYEIGHITRAVVEAYQRHVFHLRSGQRRSGSASGSAADRAAGQPLSARTQRARLYSITRFFSWAVRRGLVSANPAADIDLPRQPKPLPDYLTPEEAAAVLAACDSSDPRGLRDRAFLEVLHSTGLRRTEALRLEVGDLDHVRGIVRVQRGKGGKDRYAPIGQRALDWVARYTHEVRARWCTDAGESRLFLDRDGHPVPTSRLSSRVYRLLRSAGISKRGSCHLFRHGFATGLVEAGCDLRLIAAMLGHSTLDSTMLYTHVGVGKLVAAHRLYHQEGTSPVSAPAPPEATPTSTNAPAVAAHPVRGSSEDAPPS